MSFLAISQAPAFTQREVWLSVLFALFMEGAVLVLLASSENDTKITAAIEEELAKEVPIKVKPVLDDLPLLKLGGKKKMRQKLPDIWKKRPPVRRFEEKSAPSEAAKDSPEAIPTSKLAERDAEAPPPDAELAKEVDQELLDATPDSDPVEEGEGAPDGVKEGTETDPLKARAVNLYRLKLIGWFTARFRPPVGEIPCEELKKLSSSVSVNVGPDRSVASYSAAPSGNAIFDAKVRSTMDSLKGQQLPPPPPLYPDILESSIFPILSGAGAKCD